MKTSIILVIVMIIALQYVANISCFSYYRHKMICKHSHNYITLAYNRSKTNLPLNTNINSFNDNNSDNSYKSLYILPNSPVLLQSVVNFLHRWGYEQSSTGSAITLQKQEDSILFVFNLIKDAYLEIRAIDKNNNNEIHIQSKLNIPILTKYSEIQQQQIHSLIKLASDNLQDSITNEIGSLIMEMPTTTTVSQPSSKLMIDNDKDVDDELVIIDEEDINMEYFQANAKEIAISIPDQTYINSIWKNINNNTNTIIRSNDNNTNTIIGNNDNNSNTIIGNNDNNISTYTVSTSTMDTTQISNHILVSVLPNNHMASLNHTSISSTTTIGSSSIDDDDDNRIIYTWRDIDSISATSNILVALQTWAAKYTRKGVGIEMISLSDGIQVDLAIQNDLIYLHFLVKKQSNTVVQVVLEVVDIKDKKLLNNNKELRELMNISNTTKEIYDMIVQVTANLSKNLRNYLQDIYIDPQQLDPNNNNNNNSSATLDLTETTATTSASKVSNIVTSFTNNRAAKVPLVLEIPQDDVIYAVPKAINAVNQANSILTKPNPNNLSMQLIEDKTNTVIPPNDLQAESILHSNNNNNIMGDNQQYLNPKTPITQKTSASTIPKRKSFKDPITLKNAQDIGLNLEKFVGKGIEESAMEELNNMLKNSRQEGFISFIKNYDTNNANNNMNSNNTNTMIDYDIKTIEKNVIENNNSNNNLSELFEKGKEFSSLTLQNIMNRPPISRTMTETTEDLLQPTTQLPVYLKDNAVAKGEGGVDIFQSPSELYNSISSSSNDYKIATTSTSSLYMQEIIQKQSETPPEEETYDLDKQRLSTLLTELNRTSIEFHDTIIDAYRDLLLSDNFLFILRDANKTIYDWNTRQLFKKLTEKSIYLTAELGALVKSESVRHLQTIQDVCEIAAELQHDEVKFLERMYYIKPRFDTAFLAYLNYAIQEESIKLKQTLGITDVNMHASDWLQILQIIKQGTIAEFESRYNQLLEPLLLVIRFDDIILRENIFERFINNTPVMELPFMKALALNMISNILIRSSITSDIDLNIVVNPFSNKPYSSADNTKNYDETLIKSMKDLKFLVDKYLTDEIIQNKINEFEIEVNKQGKSIVIRNRNPVIQAEIETLQDLTNKNMNNILNGSYNKDVEYIKLLDNL